MMSDAFECDRCGELSGGPAEMKVATKGITDIAGSVSLSRREKRDTGTAQGGLLTGTRRFGHNATYSINGGDLCDGCAEAFREFWGESDD